MIICFPWGRLSVTWSLRIDLNSFCLDINRNREWILNTFKNSWCFLKLFIVKFIPNINDEHARDYSCPRPTFAFFSHGEKSPRQGGLPVVQQRVTHLGKLPRGNEKLMLLMLNSNRHQTVDWGKVNLRVTDLPRVKQLPRKHVNRPFRCILLNQFRFRWLPFFGMCILLTHSSENDRLKRSPKPSTPKSRRFSRLSRHLRFFSKLAITLARSTVEFEFKRGRWPRLQISSNETTSSSRLSDFHKFICFWTSRFCFWRPTVFRIQKVWQV